MKYEILYQSTYPIIKMDLEQGEFIRAESDAMVAMDNTIDIDGKLEGGVMGGLGRMISGESLFLQTLKANRGKGEVILATSLPGSIQSIKLDGSYSLTIQKDGFLAGTGNVNINTKVQNLTRGLFSGEGFFILEASGEGLVFISSFGAIHAISLKDGEEKIIDNKHLVAWPSHMDYNIEKASSSGWVSSITSGESLVCRFKGPGTILIQTRNLSSFASQINMGKK